MNFPLGNPSAACAWRQTNRRWYNGSMAAAGMNTQRQRRPSLAFIFISIMVVVSSANNHGRSERFPLIRILLESRVRVMCLDGDSDSAAAFFFCSCCSSVLFLSPLPTGERHVFLRYAQCFPCGWNPCMPVRTLSSHGIFAWPASHKSKVLLNIVARAAYNVTFLHVCRTSRAIALPISPSISLCFLHLD